MQGRRIGGNQQIQLRQPWPRYRQNPAIGNACTQSASSGSAFAPKAAGVEVHARHFAQAGNSAAGGTERPWRASSAMPPPCGTACHTSPTFRRRCAGSGPVAVGRASQHAAAGKAAAAWPWPDRCQARRVATSAAVCQSNAGSVPDKGSTVTPGQLCQQAQQAVLHCQHDVRTRVGRTQQRDKAHHLQGIAQPLLGPQQQGLAGQRLALPALRRPAWLCSRPFPARLVVRPGLGITPLHQQTHDRQVEAAHRRLRPATPAPARSCLFRLLRLQRVHWLTRHGQIVASRAGLSPAAMPVRLLLAVHACA